VDSIDTFQNQRLVYVVDDDVGICRGLSSLLRSEGLDVVTFESPQALLGIEIPRIPNCIILDVRLKGTSGLTFQQEVVRAGILSPIIFLTAFGDIEMTVQAMKAGAFDFLTKPFRDQDVLDAVNGALKKSEANLALQHETARVSKRYATLTSREREIVMLVSTGMRNKQIADRMDLSEVTIKIHRSHAMKKLSIESVAELVKIMDFFPSASDQ
jgi:FixJ family two-component response regulator